MGRRQTRSKEKTDGTAEICRSVCLSYEELDHSEELKSSDPVKLAEAMIKLCEIVPLQIFGGCCGTDGRHMPEIAKRVGERGGQSPLIHKK